MSLKERIFSLETEYGIQFYPDQESDLSAGNIVQCLIEAVANDYGITTTQFLLNGSKLHYDVGHPEWSLPECRSARQAATYDKAADYTLREAIPKAEARLAEYNYPGHLIVFKNNFDSAGNTFGCHENYLMQKNAQLLGGVHFLRYLVRCLIPFLITRPLLCGAGRLRVNENGSLSYELSQRSQFIEAIVSVDTQHNRAIVNIGREDQSLSPTENRRLHLILGDSNVSGWSTWMKLGTTGLLLRLIEDLYFNDFPVLADPLTALGTVSNDSDRSQTILLRDGQSVQALDIQWQYYEAVSDYVEHFGLSDEEGTVLEAWGDALQDLGNDDDPLLLRDRADWAIKKRLLDAKLKSLGHTWQDRHLDEESIAALRAIDMRYHDVGKDGYYTALWPDDTLVTREEIEVAEYEPPAYTRANIRGEAIYSADVDELEIEVERWTDLTLDERKINLRDPLQFVHPQIPDTCSETELITALEDSDTTVVLRAIDYLGRLGGEENLTLLSDVIDNTENDLVRRAAIEAVGEMEDCDNISVLIESLAATNVHTRWAAEAAMKRANQPKAGDKWGDDSIAETDDDEPLVNLTS